MLLQRRRNLTQQRQAETTRDPLKGVRRYNINSQDAVAC
jgi:hypothetical protein